MGQKNRCRGGAQELQCEKDEQPVSKQSLEREQIASSAVS